VTSRLFQRQTDARYTQRYTWYCIYSNFCCHLQNPEWTYIQSYSKFTYTSLYKILHIAQI